MTDQLKAYIAHVVDDLTSGGMETDDAVHSLHSLAAHDRDVWSLIFHAVFPVIQDFGYHLLSQLSPIPLFLDYLPDTPPPRSSSLLPPTCDSGAEAFHELAALFPVHIIGKT